MDGALQPECQFLQNYLLPIKIYCHSTIQKSEIWNSTNPDDFTATREMYIPQSQTADKPMAAQGRASHQSSDTRKTNKAKQPALSSPSK